MYIEELREMVPPPSQNTVGVCNKITLLILYYMSSKLVTRLKIIDNPKQVSNIFFLFYCYFEVNLFLFSDTPFCS
jgi:hypothetical protein